MNLITTPVAFGQYPPENSILHSTSVSFTGRSPSEPVHIVQYDLTVPVIAISLTANGQPYTVPSGAAVNIRLAKPDGHYVYNPAYGVSDDGQTVYIAVTLQMTAVSGKVSPIIEVVVNGTVAGTGFFVLDIDPNPIPEDAIESTDEYKTIQQLAAEAAQAAQIIQNSQESIDFLQKNSELIESVNNNSESISAVGQNIASVNTVSSGMSYIQSAAQNIGAIQAAPSAASEASASANSASSNATLSESWAVGGTGTREGEDTNNAQYYAQQAQQVSQGALGWYATPQALQSAHPIGQNGQWAIIGTTDTIWTWDSDTSAWVNSGAQVDLSNYYTKSQADSAFARKSHASTLSTYGTGSSAVYGHVKLSDTPDTSGVSNGTAATPKCVQDAVQAGLNNNCQYLYKATFLVDGWSGDGPYTQTVSVQAVDGGPVITSASHMTSGLFCDDTVQGDAQEALLEAAALVDKGKKTFGSGTITCVLENEKPTTDAEVYFNAKKGGA